MQEEKIDTMALLSKSADKDMELELGSIDEDSKSAPNPMYSARPRLETHDSRRAIGRATKPRGTRASLAGECARPL